MTTTTTRTFGHLIANSTYHHQAPSADAKNANPVKTIVFAGPQGGTGVYVTSDAAEIEALSKLAKNPQVQVFEIVAEAPVESPKQAPANIPAEEVMKQAAIAAAPVATAGDAVAKALAAARNA